MTKQIILLSMAMVFSGGCFGQTLEKNEVDEFTGRKVKHTSLEVLTKNMRFSLFYRIMSEDDKKILNIKMMIGNKVFSISEGDELMFKMKDGQVIILPCLEFVVTCTGCGARGFGGSAGQGINANYLLSQENFELLRTGNLEKIRVHTSLGYGDADITDSNSKTFQRTFMLLN